LPGPPKERRADPDFIPASPPPSTMNASNSRVLGTGPTCSDVAAAVARRSVAAKRALTLVRAHAPVRACRRPGEAEGRSFGRIGARLRVVRHHWRGPAVQSRATSRNQTNGSASRSVGGPGARSRAPFLPQDRAPTSRGCHQRVSGGAGHALPAEIGFRGDSVSRASSGFMPHDAKSRSSSSPVAPGTRRGAVAMRPARRCSTTATLR